MSGGKKKHDWNSWENYLSIHETILDKYINSHYVSGPKKYTVTKFTDQSVDISIEGLILKSNYGVNIQFKIEKTVELDTDYKRPRAKVFSYSYHALTPKPNARNIMRYCSPHEHRKYHHKHIYNSAGSNAVVNLADGTWPHVSEFFEEVLNTEI